FASGRPPRGRHGRCCEAGLWRRPDRAHGAGRGNGAEHPVERDPPLRVARPPAWRGDSRSAAAPRAGVGDWGRAAAGVSGGRFTARLWGGTRRPLRARMPGRRVGLALRAAASARASARPYGGGWERARRPVRTAMVGIVLAILVIQTRWTVARWREIQGMEVTLGLPGATRMRVNERDAADTRGLVTELQARCTSFLVFPGFSSLYF